LYKFAPDFQNKCQKMQLDLCIVYTQEANSCNAELGVKISCASSLLTANGECTFYVAVKIGGRFKKNAGVGGHFI
jgi:hypothetical protein